ncbi:glycosyltransferase [Reinekea thalattae]|uniref:Glycosyltransferase n=1 Tax=Reinekea thalattae TaxID=2593301 RepID=A0A5C8Z7T0_9GAMM|nr:glycosyltransferase [Reinekea thalattae]TXR53353.1 glycosyltransferase [Reinekea thalattae]
MAVQFSVILSAYNNFAALNRALPFWFNQTCLDFELIIADDGSTQEQIASFHAAVERLNNANVSVKHIWHEDEGFDKCGMLNQAILVASAPRLLFLDADMLPRFDLVANHICLLKPGFFITGGSHVNVNEAGQQFLAELEQGAVNKANQLSSLFASKAFVEHGFIAKNKASRVSTFGIQARVKDFLTWRSNAFTGANSSCWKSDALRVNGFDKDWGYGGLDRDFGIRLTNAGTSSRRHQYSLVALHQEHGRPYRKADKVRQNKVMLKQRMRDKAIKIENGIDKLTEKEIRIIWANK